ncbi:lipopolysaccharide heptosyltransferase I [Nitratifractor sp.]
MKLGIVRLSALGDIIHTAASLQFIQAALPDTQITWFVDKRFAGILSHHPQIDKLVPLDLSGLKKERSLGKLSETRQRIKEAGPFDLVIDVQGLIKSTIVSRLACANVAGLDRRSAREGIASLLYRHRYPVDCAGVAPVRFASLLSQALQIEITEEMMAAKEPCLFFDPERDRSAIDIHFETERKNLLLVVGASAPHKTYPPEKWIEVAKGLEEHNILLVAGNDVEREAARTIEAHSPAHLLPSMDLDTLKYAVARCDLLLGGDTGPSHIAWAMNRPSILLFGATPRTMMFETTVNLAISSGHEPHPCRFDKSDRSIVSIEPHEITHQAQSLLDGIISEKVGTA